MENINTLSISEDFFSIQGEGITSGYPAYFIRLRGCNLMCGGRNGDLLQKGLATWWCDTEAVWRKGNEKQFDYLLERWQQQGLDGWVTEGRVHLIWTGGEPTLPRHQQSIVNFLQWFNRHPAVIARANCLGLSKPVVYNEIETNGTGYLNDELFEQLDQINCSVKLSNSGEPYERRFQKTALQRLMLHPNYWFKFVISKEEDVMEIMKDFIAPLNIPFSRIIMMPGLDCAANFNERTRFCLEMAKKYGYIGLSRLHVAAYDKTTGV